MTTNNYVVTEQQRDKIIDLSCDLMETLEEFQKQQDGVDLLVLELAARDFLTDVLAANLVLVEKHTDTVMHPASIEKHLDQTAVFTKASVLRKYKDPEFIKLLGNGIIKEEAHG